MKARKKFFTMFLSMLLVFTMMPLSAIPVTAAGSTDPPPAALDQTKPVDETLTETDIQTETESTTTPEPPPVSETQATPETLATPEPDPGITTTGRMTVSQPAMLAGTTEDAHMLVIMEDGTEIKLFPGKAIFRNNSNGASDPISGKTYVAELQRTEQDQYTSYGKWTLILKSFHAQSITYVKGSGGATGQYIDIKLYGNSVLTAGEGSVTDYQKSYRGLSCGSATEGNEPLGNAIGFRIQSAYDDSDASLTIRADYKTARFMNYAQGIFTSDLYIGKRATVRIDVAVPERNESSAIHAGNLYLKDNSSLDIKCSNTEQAVRVYSSGHGVHHLDIDTAGSVNIRMQNQDRLSYSRAFDGAIGATNSFHMNRVGDMRIVTEGLYNSSAAGEKYDFDIYPDWDSVDEGLTKVKFEGNGFHQIQYIPGATADAVHLYVCDGRIKDGRYTFYNQLYRALTNGTADITITAPESNIPFKKWVALSANSSTEESSISYLATGSKSTDETVTLHFDGPGTRRILAKYDPFTTPPTCTYDYSPVANCPTGKISWAAGYGLENATGRLIEDYYTLSSDGPTPATDASGNPIDKVTSGVSVFAQQAGSGINYVLPSGKWYRIALQDGSGRWHISDSFRIDYPTVAAPPAPELVSLNCSGEETTLSPSATECYPFARGLIVKATNFDYDKYEMYYTFNNGGTDPGDPTGTSPSTSSGVIVLKNSETWTGVTNLRVRFKSKTTGAWSPTTKVPLKKVPNDDIGLYCSVAFAPEGNYEQSNRTVTIRGPITATVTKDHPEKWPINAELVYSTKRVASSATYTNYTEETVISFDPATIAASGYDAAYLQVGVRVPDPKSSSNDCAILGGSTFYTIKLPDANKLWLENCTATVDGNSVANNTKVEVGKTVILTLNVPEGYTFKGWYCTIEDLTITPLADGTYFFYMPDHDITVRPILYAQEYTDVNVVFTTPSDGALVETAGIDTRKTSPSEMSVDLQWYKGSQPYHGVFESEKACYRIHITCHAAEGAIFSDSVKIKVNKSPDNGWPVTRDFTLSDDKKTLEFDAWLVYAPEITIPLHEGDSTKPTAADCILPPGLTVETLTWNTDGTIKELRVKEPSYPFGDTICRFSFGNGWATINGQRYQGEFGTDHLGRTDTGKLIFKDISIPTVSKGVKVRGTITSYGDANETVTVTLLQGTSIIGSPQMLTGVSGSAPYDQAYSFDTVPAGTYTLKVEKKGHAPFTREITVGDSDVTEDVTMYLIGDVTMDGEVDIDDANTMLQYLVGEITLAAEQMAVFDITGDGIADIDDSNQLLQWVVGNISDLYTGV